jgi:hypothetical protein
VKRTTASHAARRVVRRSIRERHPLDRRREQHLLRVDLIVPAVFRELVLAPQRDRVEGTGDLAVAAEDAAAHVDLVDPRVALAGRDAVVGRVLGRDDADAVRGARGRAERAADAFLEAVLVAVQTVAAAEARVERTLVLRVLLRDRLAEDLAERDSEALEGAERLRHQSSPIRRS